MSVVGDRGEHRISAILISVKLLDSPWNMLDMMSVGTAPSVKRIR